MCVRGIRIFLRRRLNLVLFKLLAVSVEPADLLSIIDNPDSPVRFCVDGEFLPASCQIPSMQEAQLLVVNLNSANSYQRNKVIPVDRHRGSTYRSGRPIQGTG